MGANFWLTEPPGEKSPMSTPLKESSFEDFDRHFVSHITDADPEAPLGRKELQVLYREFPLLERFDHLVPDGSRCADNGYVK